MEHSALHEDDERWWLGHEPEPEPEPEVEAHHSRSWRNSPERRRQARFPLTSSSDEEWTLAEHSESEKGSTASTHRGELGSLSVEALKARAREMRYVNEETLAAVDDMASPKRYLIDLLTLTLASGARLALEQQDPELSVAHLSDGSSSTVHRERAAAPEPNGFRDPELSEAELSDTSPFWHRAEESPPFEQRQTVAAAPPAASSWRPEPEPALRRVSLAKAQRKYDEAMVCLCNPVPLESERAMTLLESALHLLGLPWDHASQELTDLIQAKLKAVPRRYLSDELQARSARQRDWEYDWQAAGRFSKDPVTKTGGRLPSPRARSPQGARALTRFSPQRVTAGSPRRGSTRRRQIQDAYARAELNKEEGLVLERQRNFAQALRRYDAALKILEEVHADDKQCADMTALLQRKRQACSHTLLQQAGASKAASPSQVSLKSKRQKDRKKELDDLLDDVLKSPEGTITRTREVYAGWRKHMRQVAALYETADPTEMRRQRAGARQPQAVDLAERSYTAAVEAFNRGDDHRALELIEASEDNMPPAFEGSADRKVLKLRKAIATFQQEMTKLQQEQHQLLLDVRAACLECQMMQEKLSSKSWDAVAAESRPGRGRVYASPGRGGEAKWNPSVTQHALAPSRTGLKATVAHPLATTRRGLTSATEASGATDTGQMSEREMRLKTAREMLDSTERLLRRAQTRRRRGGARGRASASPERDATGDGRARQASPRRQFSTAISKHDLSTSPTGHNFKVPPKSNYQKQIIRSTQDLLDDAIRWQKIHDHARADDTLKHALQQLGQPWGGESKRLQEELQQRIRTSRRALHRPGTSKKSPSTRAASPSSSRNAGSREEPQTRESVSRNSTGDRQHRRDLQVSFSDTEAGHRTRVEEGAHGVPRRSGQQRPLPVHTAGRKYEEAVAAFEGGDIEEALELVEKGIELLPAGSTDGKAQQLRRKMEDFQREKEELAERRKDEVLRQRELGDRELREFQSHQKQQPAAAGGTDSSRITEARKSRLQHSAQMLRQREQTEPRHQSPSRQDGY
eukprot:COSAG02_NODE_276_length_26189_cov_810.678191_6_plen_1037_part_00